MLMAAVTCNKVVNLFCNHKVKIGNQKNVEHDENKIINTLSQFTEYVVIFLYILYFR